MALDATTPALHSVTDGKLHAETTVSGYASSDEESISSNPFLDQKVAEHYRSLYNKAEYECRHVFDPTLEWTKEEEKAVVRKVDWHVATWACIMFFALNVDRGNLKQAVSDNLLNQLHLSTNDYNYGQCIRHLQGVPAYLSQETQSSMYHSCLLSCHLN